LAGSPSNASSKMRTSIARKTPGSRRAQEGTYPAAARRDGARGLGQAFGGRDEPSHHEPRVHGPYKKRLEEDERRGTLTEVRKKDLEVIRAEEAAAKQAEAKKQPEP
jgi:hypothetical protein